MSLTDERKGNVGGEYGGYYKIGFDIGIASVGWAALACDGEGNVSHILDMGVRTFDIPENPKNGASLAAPRRESRSARRRLRRRNHRLERARELLGLEKESPAKFKDSKLPDVYELRFRALDEKISEEDFSRVLMLILKRRGYNSDGKREQDKDDGKVKAALSKNENTMRERGYRTVGEMIYREFSHEENGRRIYDVRNHENYNKCFTRALLADELRILFATQRKFGNPKADEATEQKFMAIFTAQRNFDEGPGKGSNYSAEYKVGKCPFEKNEERIAKASFSFEYFRLLQSVNHLRISEKGTERALTDKERSAAVEYCKNKEKVTYGQLRKLLKMSNDAIFCGLLYKGGVQPKAKKKETKVAPGQIGIFETAETEVAATANNSNVEKADLLKATEDKARFCIMSGSKKIRDCLIEERKDNVALLDALAEILSRCKSDKKIRERIASDERFCSLTEEEISKITGVSVSGFGHVGHTVITKVLPYLEQGFIYSEAMEKAGYDHANPAGEQARAKYIDMNEQSFKEEFADITSPAVRCSVAQTVRVLNAIIGKFGSPVAINVELAREMSKTFDERKEIKKDNDARFEENEKTLNIIKGLGVTDPHGQDLIKYRLYEEQGGKCMYSGKDLKIDRVLHDPKYVEIDHAIPYSRSFCDAWYNKVLVLTEENQKKGNATPKEYLGDGERWDEFCARVNALPNLSKKKKETLLREKFTVENGKEWKDRTLNDTKYISSFMLNLLRRRLLFADCNMGKKRVTAVNGVITSQVRKLWGIQKVREDGDLHHAVDAVVIGCIGDGLIGLLTKWAQGRELRYAFENGKAIERETGVVIDPKNLENCPKRLAMPHEKFVDELNARLSDDPTLYNDEYFKYGYDSEEVQYVRKVFVSRAPERKAKGAIHQETIYSVSGDGNTTLKTPIEKLKLGSDGEIEGYNEIAKNSDRLLYDALKKRLTEAGGDGKKAFAAPFHKPKADGSNGPIVKKVIINQLTDAHVQLKRGMASNDGMVRVDIFCKNGKYYGVPVYVADVYQGRLPNKAVVAQKPEDEWLEMTDDYEFKFALYKNDLLKIESKKGMEFSPLNAKSGIRKTNSEFVYYKKFGRATGSISIITHDNSFSIPSLGIQNVGTLTKYTVDILGEYHEVKSEKRPPACMKNR